MNIENKLQLLQQQKLVLTPELKQAITVLQLPLLELEPFLVQQLQENPVLELEVGESGEISLDNTEKEKNPEEWLEYFSNKSDLGINNAPDKKEYFYERASAPLPQLKDLLHEQALHAFSHEDRKVAYYLIEFIDDKGYLQLEDNEVLQYLKITPEKYYEIISKIQQFEPAGVGARTLKECLTIQILQRHYPKAEEEILLKLVEDFLEYIADGKIAKLAQEFALSAQQMQTYCDEIKKLNPFPGASYSTGSASYIVPDIVVEKVSGEFIIIVNDAALPRITMSETYLALLSKEKDENVHKYIQQKIHAATWLLKSIEQRRLTLYKVANTILDMQQDFFEQGKDYLKPLVLRQIAEVLEMHESTISRAVANKYMQTPHGVYPLKFFFTGGLSTATGEDRAVSAIKDRLKEMIAQENTKNPLSDQKIADVLNNEGINISRRTVAKYREEMHLPSSAKRKRY